MATPDLSASVSSPFAPPPEGWQRVSPTLGSVRRVISVAVCLVLGLGVAIPLAVWVGWPWALLAILFGIGVAAWLWWLVARQVAAIGYAERDDDLVVTQGILFRSLVVVPYGRMQLVDLKAGPVDRRYGMATLQLHTAAATTDAVIPGLPVAEAERLRDRLAALGEARSAGL